MKSSGEGITLVSGACPEGADNFAAEAAALYNVPIVEFPIDKHGIKNRWEFTQRAYARNRQIVDRAEGLFCWIHSDRAGGTENTISQELEMGKRIYLVTEEGSVYLSLDGQIPKCDPALRLLDSNSIG
jgi:hypothetical protein